MKAKRLFLLSILLSLVLIGEAQVRFQQKDTVDNGKITFARFRTDSVPISLGNSGKVLRDMHRMRADDELRLTKTDRDGLDYTHQYFQQYYKGVRVAYGTYAAHASKSGFLETALGNFQPVGDVAITPKLSESQALQYALKHVNAEIYKWQIPEEEKWVKEYFNETYYPKGELVIVKDRFKTDRKYCLAYKFDIYAHKPLSRDYIYVDAITGDVIEKDSRIHDTNANGTAYTRYSGARGVVTDSYSGGYRLRETRNSVRVETYNMNRTASYTQADFADNDNSWTTAEFNNLNKDNAALDAHWGAEMVYDYFSQVHGRNSFNGSGGPLLSYVHANLVAMGYPNNDNAFWDGQRMTYGDGTSLFSPLTSLDVCAHEIAHGICGTTARLRYLGESGAINEGLSDIWAACVEYYAAPNKQIWQIGEDISLLGIPLRSMANPNASLSAQPDTYNGINWVNPGSSTDRGGVHTNSGVVNYWFYLVSQGGSGTNDLGNAFSVNGIGINSAASIVYQTERWRIRSDVEQEISFTQFREASISASTDLFGANSCQTMAVTNAWYAVGVGSQFQYTNVSITGPTTVCTTGSTYTVSNLPAGCTVSWSGSSNLTLSSALGSSATFVASGSGAGWVRATIMGSCGLVAISKTVSVGKPTPPVVAGSASILCNMELYVEESGRSVTWAAAGPLRLVGGNTGYKCTVEGTRNGIGWVYATASNTCGSYRGELKVEVICESYAVYPNPATSEVTISPLSAKSVAGGTARDRVIKSVRVVDKLGATFCFQQYGSETIESVINVSGFPTGAYILTINEGCDDEESHTIVKQ